MALKMELHADEEEEKKRRALAAFQAALPELSMGTPVNPPAPAPAPRPPAPAPSMGTPVAPPSQKRGLLDVLQGQGQGYDPMGKNILGVGPYGRVALQEIAAALHPLGGPGRSMNVGAASERFNKQMAERNKRRGFGELISGMDMSEQQRQALLALGAQNPELAARLMAEMMLKEPPKPTDTMRNLEWRAMQAGLEPGTPEWQEFMRTGGRPEAPGTSLIVGPDGQLQFSQGPGVTPTGGLPINPSRLAQKVSENDAKALDEARSQAAAADALAVNLEASRRIVEGGFDSGADAGARAAMSGAGAIMGGKGEYAAQYQEFTSVSKEIGMDALRAIGGNDTERELLTAIQTTASPNKEPAANKAIIARKTAAINIITQKPGFLQEWIAANGSLANPNAQGQSWDAWWRQYQRDAFAAATQAEAPPAGSDASPAGSDAFPANPNPGLYSDERWRRMFEMMSDEEKELFR